MKISSTLMTASTTQRSNSKPIAQDKPQRTRGREEHHHDLLGAAIEDAHNVAMEDQNGLA